jgi:hypothetical protein
VRELVHYYRAASGLGFVLTAATIGAQTPSASRSSPSLISPALSVHGLVDVYYAANFNRPPDHENFEPGTGTTAKRANEFQLNLAAADLFVDAKPVTIHLIAVAGNGADVVHEGEPEGEGTGRDVLRHVYQASIAYTTPIGRGVIVEAGIFPSPIGFESFLSKDNWNYTRAWAGEFSPYYHAGISVTIPLADGWSADFHVVNGWQLVGDNNAGKSFETRLTYTAKLFSAQLAAFGGPELADDNAHWRTFGDLVVTINPNGRLRFAAELDDGYQSRPGLSPARWQAVVGEARYSFTDRAAIAVRAENFHDPDNGISGFRQTLREGTVTLEYRPHPILILKFEGRYDHASLPVFSARDATATGGKRKAQAIVLASAVATF